MKTRPGTAALAAATLKDPRWTAVAARDARADGRFYYSVSTTGVYCRPSCAARRSHPEHVRFHATCADAENAGFRPCKRCRPLEPAPAARHAAAVTAACRLMARTQGTPALKQLAAHAGMSVYHFHRVFRRITGLTPREYAAALREQRARDKLSRDARRSSTITDAIFDAGYNSSGRFYEKSGAMLGMTPGDYRRGGTGTRIRYAVGECTLGFILVAQSERGICAIALGDDPVQLVRDLQARFARAELTVGDRRFQRVVSTVIGFVEAPRVGLDLPLDVRGTVFQRRVWQALRRIPPGKTLSYAEIARRLGAPKSARAVAGACAANVLAVAIPCHRAVGSDGRLTGYRWGVERKRTLLAREAANGAKRATSGGPLHGLRQKRSISR